MDASVFLRYDPKDPSRLVGVVGVAVDDLIWAGEARCVRDMTEFNQEFGLKPWESDKFRFCGLDVVQDKEFSVTYDQATYIS